MKNGIAIIIGAITLISWAVSVQAGIYLGVNGGVSSGADSDVSLAAELADQFESVVDETEISWDNGYWASGVLGYAMESLPVRVETELFYQADDADELAAFGLLDETKAERGSYGLLVNFYYDFINGTIFTPFIGAGLGISVVDIADIGDNFRDIDDVAFAWQLGGGVALELTEFISIDVKYRYYQTSDISDRFTDSLTSDDFFNQDVENGAHLVLMGLRVELF